MLDVERFDESDGIEEIELINLESLDFLESIEFLDTPLRAFRRKGIELESSPRARYCKAHTHDFHHD